MEILNTTFRDFAYIFSKNNIEDIEFEMIPYNEEQLSQDQELQVN